MDSQSYRLYSPISSSRACHAGLVPGVPQVARLRVLGDRVGGGGDRTAARLGAHVQRLELLQRVRAAAHAQAAAHRRVQVDQDPVAQQLVDRVLTDTVPAREPQQGRPLVRGVVVDVHARVRGAALLDVRQEVDERLLLLRAVVRPERPERAVGLDHPEQVLQTPVRGRVGGDRVVGPERVALEVEEDVAGVRHRQVADRRRLDDLEHERLRRGLLADLEGRLPAQVGQRRDADAGHRLGARRQLVDRADARRRQPRTLRRPHPGHQEDVPVRDHLRGAGVAPPARPVAGITPGHRRLRGAVLVEQVLQAGAALAVQRQQVREAVAGPGAVAEDQVHVVRHRDARGDQLVRVRRQLEQGRDLHAAGQLGVEHRPPVVLAHHEVGPAGEPAVEEPGLVDDVRVRRQRRERRRLHAFERGPLAGLVVPRSRDRDDVARRRGTRRGPSARGRCPAPTRAPASRRRRSAPAPTSRADRRGCSARRARRRRRWRGRSG